MPKEKWKMFFFIYQNHVTEKMEVLQCSLFSPHIATGQHLGWPEIRGLFWWKYTQDYQVDKSQSSSIVSCSSCGSI